MTVDRQRARGTIQRVLMTADAVGGVWRYSIDLALELTRQGIDVLIATLGPRPTVDMLGQVAGRGGIEIVSSDYKLEWMPHPWVDVDACKCWLQSLERRFAPDIIHLNQLCLSDADWLAPVLTVAHSCVFSWWQAVLGSNPPSEWAEYQGRVKTSLAASQSIVTPTHAMEKRLKKDYGKLPRTTVIENFSTVQAIAARKRNQLLACGRVWDPAKNTALLERIACRLSWPLVVAGQTQEPGSRVQSTSKLKLLGHIAQPELLAQLSASSIFVHPAYYEPFGLSVLEAARCGCALVLSDIPSLRELWEEAAIFVAPDDDEEWISQINHLAANPSFLAKWAAAAHRRSLTFSVERTVNAYFAVYSLLKNGNDRPLTYGQGSASCCEDKPASQNPEREPGEVFVLDDATV